MTSVALMASARLESPYQGVPDVWVWVIPCHGAVPCTVQVLAESLPSLHPQTQHLCLPTFTWLGQSKRSPDAAKCCLEGGTSRCVNH